MIDAIKPTKPPQGRATVESVNENHSAKFVAPPDIPL